MKTTFFTLCYILPLFIVPVAVHSQDKSTVLHKKVISLRNEIRKDEEKNLSFQEMQDKYLHRLTAMEKELETCIAEVGNYKIGDTESSKKLNKLRSLQSSINTSIFKITIMETILNGPRTKAVADSLLAIYKLKNKREVNQKTFELLVNYERELTDEVITRRYPVVRGPNGEDLNLERRKAGIDSVNQVMRALGFIRPPVVRKYAGRKSE
ncbi:MAG: hypothetical protein LBS20_10315 [Prevotella sp.]|jgi:hypothetical protein|nr:hypothetical protein [Prevotella sp.]